MKSLNIFINITSVIIGRLDTPLADPHISGWAAVSSASILIFVTGHGGDGAVIGNRAEERGISTATTTILNDSSDENKTNE